MSRRTSRPRPYVSRAAAPIAAASPLTCAAPDARMRTGTISRRALVRASSPAERLGSSRMQRHLPLSGVLRLLDVRLLLSVLARCCWHSAGHQSRAQTPLVCEPFHAGAPGARSVLLQVVENRIRIRHLHPLPLLHDGRLIPQVHLTGGGFFQAR